MSERLKADQTILAELARVKALFQQRSILAHLGKMPPGSKADQENQQRSGE